jgi:arylsulfatase A-like enzyme
MVPALLGKTQRNHEFLYWEFFEAGFQQAVRVGDWKGVRLAPGKALELYDLRTDLAESNDIAAKHPDVVATIERILKSARTESEFWPDRRPAKKGA